MNDIKKSIVGGSKSTVETIVENKGKTALVTVGVAAITIFGGPIGWTVGGLSLLSAGVSHLHKEGKKDQQKTYTGKAERALVETKKLVLKKSGLQESNKVWAKRYLKNVGRGANSYGKSMVNLYDSTKEYFSSEGYSSNIKKKVKKKKNRNRLK